MLTKLPQSWQNRQIKVKTLSIIAACCFVMGLAIPVRSAVDKTLSGRNLAGAAHPWP